MSEFCFWTFFFFTHIYILHIYTVKGLHECNKMSNTFTIKTQPYTLNL